MPKTIKLVGQEAWFSHSSCGVMAQPLSRGWKILEGWRVTMVCSNWQFSSVKLPPQQQGSASDFPAQHCLVGLGSKMTDIDQPIGQ